MNERPIVIAVDFDGTIVQEAFPLVGEKMPHAIETLTGFQAKGYKVVLWTCRAGEFLSLALEWLKANGVVVDSANCNVIATEGYAVPKIYADVYIDDRNFGGFPGWAAIYGAMVENDYDFNRKPKVSVEDARAAQSACKPPDAAPSA